MIACTAKQNGDCPPAWGRLCKRGSLRGLAWRNDLLCYAEQDLRPRGTTINGRFRNEADESEPIQMSSRRVMSGILSRGHTFDFRFAEVGAARPHGVIVCSAEQNGDCPPAWGRLCKRGLRARALPKRHGADPRLSSH
jgi:hypothetical protein